MKYFLFFLFFLCFTVAQAQYHNTGTEPAGVKWRQIKTNKFTIIYPQETDSLAQRYAWLLDKSYRAVATPLRSDLLHMPVVLHPYNVYSNGKVVWTPRRIELITTPPTMGYAQMWDKQLVLHEIRHAAQMSKLDDGFFKYLHYFIGEQSEGIAVGVYIANWYLEGDATVSETAGSETGRGRQAEFLMPIKAFLLTDYKFSWDTWTNGSYQYKMPTDYQLGYLLSSYAYKQAGINIFGDMLSYTTHHPLNIPPPSKALKQYGGFDEQELFEQSFEYMKQQWAHEDSIKKADDNLKQITPEMSKGYVSYRSAVVADNNMVVAIRNDLKKANRFVVIDTNGKEKFIRYTANINSLITSRHNQLYWSASVPHERWEQMSFSVIKKYDLNTHCAQSLTRYTRYFSPAPSPDEKWLAVVENTAKGENFLVLLDTKKYKPAQRIALPSGEVLKEITWSDNALQLYCAVLSDNGLAIKQYDLSGKKWEILLPSGISGINRLTTYKEYVLFESGYNGTNNIYALNVRSRKMFQITNARFGAFDPAVSADSTELLFSNYVATGYHLAAIPIAEQQWKEVSFTTPATYELADTVSAQVKYSIDTLQIPSQPIYASKKYNRFLHAFKVHSWTPFYYNPDALKSASLDKDIFEQIGWGVTVLSQNILGTLTSRLGYKYKNGFNSGHLSLTYYGWYPVIDYALDINDRYRVINSANFDQNNQRVVTLISTKDPYISSRLRLYIPFQLTRSAWRTGIIPQVGYFFSNDEYYSVPSAKTQYYQYLQAGLYFYQQLSLAVRDIYPRWGYSFRALRSFPLFSNNLQPITTFQASVYTPGILLNHGMLLTAGHQWHDDKQELWISNGYLKLPRGYTDAVYGTITNATLDYAFPLWYPDINLSWIVYFKRLRMNLFSDYAHVTVSGAKTNLVSIGTEVLVDFHILRFGFPIAAGVRYAQPLVNDPQTKSTAPSFSLLFDINL